MTQMEKRKQAEPYMSKGMRDFAKQVYHEAKDPLQVLQRERDASS